MAHWIAEIRREFGCYVFREAVRILSEFVGLVLANGAVRMEPLGATWVREPILWHYWEWELGEVLFPIGELTRNQAILAVGASGRIVATGVVDSICGSSFEAALEQWYVEKNLGREDLDVIAERKRPDSVSEATRYLCMAFGEEWDEAG